MKRCLMFLCILGCLLIFTTQASSDTFTRTQNFNTDPNLANGGDWYAHLPTSGPADFGYKTTNYAGGVAAGEGGGKFARIGQPAYYADVTWSGELTLEDAFHAEGQWNKASEEGTPDSGLQIGFLNLNTNDFMAFNAADPNRLFINTTLANDSDAIAYNFGFDTYDINVPYYFVLDYDPDTLYGVVSLELFTDSTKSSSLQYGDIFLTEGQRNLDITFNAFGMWTNAGSAPRYDVQYIDDISYTMAFSYVATNPAPYDTETLVAKTTDIVWDTAGGATSQDVYFGTNPLSLSSIASSLAGDVTEVNNADLIAAYGALSGGTTYYWRVDSAGNDEGGSPYTKGGQGAGTVWSFTTIPDTGPVSNPFPFDGCAVASASAKLIWTPYGGEDHFEVYTGSSPGSLTLEGTTSSNSYDLSGLSAGATVYWRVDGVYTVPATTITGTEQSFTVGTTSLEFEDFDVDPTTITWSDTTSRGVNNHDFGYVDSKIVSGADPNGETGGYFDSMGGVIESWNGRPFKDVNSPIKLEASGQFQCDVWPPSNSTIGVGHFSRDGTYGVGFTIINRYQVNYMTTGFAWDATQEQYTGETFEDDVTYNWSYVYDPVTHIISLKIKGGQVDYSGSYDMTNVGDPDSDFNVNTFGILYGFAQAETPSLSYYDNMTYTIGDDLDEGLFPNPMDFNEDDIVNFEDFAEFAEQWLKGKVL